MKISWVCIAAYLILQNKRSVDLKTMQHKKYKVKHSEDID